MDRNTYTAAGLRPFPCRIRFDPVKQKYDKDPAVPKGVSWKTADPAIMDWTGIDVWGVPVPEGVIVLDIDSYKPAYSPKAVTALLGQLPWAEAHVQDTISGGQHYAFRAPEWPVRQLNEADKTGVDTRVAGKGFLCTGAGYTPIGGFGLLRMAHPESLPLLPDSCRAALEAVTLDRPTPELPQGDRDVDTIIAALGHIDPGVNRAEWVRYGLALRHQFHDDPDTGRAVFESWSAGEFWPDGCPENYEPESIDHQWFSFKPEGGTTIGTVFYAAAQGGWTPPSGSFDTAAAFGAQAVPCATFDALIDWIHESGGDPKSTDELLNTVKGLTCSTVQKAVLLASLHRELKDAGLLTKALGKQLDAAAGTAYRSPLPAPIVGNILTPSDPMHPDLWAKHHTKGKDMKPRGTLDNFRAMLKAYGIGITFDEVARDVHIHGEGVPAGGTLMEEAALAHLDHLANLNDFPKADNKAMIMAEANNNTINPVREWVQSAPWDGTDRISQLFGCLTLDPDEDAVFCEKLFRKWLRGAVAIGTGITDVMEHVLTFVDPEGGMGKTRFFRTLCPAPLRKDSLLLDPTNKDSIKIATSCWLVELGELDGTFSRADQARLKAFLSLATDEIRLPYGRTYMKYPRRTAFFASVNKTGFLVDTSNNRRYWPIRVLHANHLHTIDMQQAWAQVAVEVAQGHTWHLSDEENKQIGAHNDGFREASRIADALSVFFDGVPTGLPYTRLETITSILILAGVFHPTKGELNEGGAWLRRNKFEWAKQGSRRGFFIPDEANITAAAFKPEVVT